MVIQGRETKPDAPLAGVKNVAMEVGRFCVCISLSYGLSPPTLQLLVVAPSQELAMQIVWVAQGLLPDEHRRMVQQCIGGANPKYQAGQCIAAAAACGCPHTPHFSSLI